MLLSCIKSGSRCCLFGPARELVVGQGGHLECIAFRSYGNCDNNSANGCEVNLYTDLNNCGSCGKTAALPNAASVFCSVDAGGPTINSCVSG
jgi:hypothetical protein